MKFPRLFELSKQEQRIVIVILLVLLLGTVEIYFRNIDSSDSNARNNATPSESAPGLLQQDEDAARPDDRQ
ncbi:MAG: hypothetical protein ABJB69_09380 [Spartobacteria bacterium]